MAVLKAASGNQGRIALSGFHEGHPHPQLPNVTDGEERESTRTWSIHKHGDGEIEFLKLFGKSVSLVRARRSIASHTLYEIMVFGRLVQLPDWR